MKKLLSICFLSIFLMMFGMQAQAQGCCFKLTNPSGDTLREVVNLPGGELPLSHTMEPTVRFNTDVYDLVFANDVSCLSVAKVSIELQLWLDGENVLDGNHNLSRYCDITMKTIYNELKWIGGPMIGTNYGEYFEYPGAVHQFEGTYNTGNINFDFFYFEFLKNSQTKLFITWKQVFREVRLVAIIRERVNGTNNELYWDPQERLNIGGRGSQRASVLSEDQILPLNRITINMHDTIKSCDTVMRGYPLITLDTSGTYKVAYVDTVCNYVIDSVVTYHFTRYVHPTTPTLSDSTLRYCQKGLAEITLDQEPDTTLCNNNSHCDSIRPYWYYEDLHDFAYADTFRPITDTAAGNYFYYVKRFDSQTGCQSEVDTFTVTIVPSPANPVVTNPIVQYCVGDTASVLTYPAPDTTWVLWGTSHVVDQMDTTSITPVTLTDSSYVFYLRLMDTSTVNACVSDGYDSIKVRVFNNPTVTITHNVDTLCYGEVVTLTADSGLTKYVWKKDNVVLPDDTTRTCIDTNKVAAPGGMTVYSLTVTMKHDSVTCKSKAVNDTITVYPQIGTPVPVSIALLDTSICVNDSSVTLAVTHGANGTTSIWYAKDKTTVLASDTTKYTYHVTFTGKDTVYAASRNDFECETPADSMLCFVITIDTLPVVTLTYDTAVCAEQSMVIHSTPFDATYTYAWSGDSLGAIKTVDSVTFISSKAGTYYDTLRVTNGNACHADFFAKIRVDTLPVLVVSDYTVKNNEFCVDSNGKITFNTEYVKYSIDNGTTWRNHPNNVFDTLGARLYKLKVEDGNGCVNKTAVDANLKDTLTYPALTIVDSANTRCQSPYNGKLAVQVTPAPAAGKYVYEYQLDGAAAVTDSVFTALKDTNVYKITVTNTITGCKTDSLNQVVTNKRPTLVPVLAQTPNTHCQDIDFDGTVAVTSVTDGTLPLAPAYVYQYKLATTAYQTDTLFTGLAHDFYTVTVKDTISACTGSDTITVLFDGVLPTATVTGPAVMCFNDTNSLFTYTIPVTDTNTYFKNWVWSTNIPDSIGNLYKTSDTFDLAGRPAGDYTVGVVIRDTVTHCQNTISFITRVDGVNIELISTPSEVCEFDTVKVYYKYNPIKPAEDTIVDKQWYANCWLYFPEPRDTAWIVPSFADTLVSLKVKDNHGCEATAVTKNLIVNKLPQITITGDTAYCENTTTSITATLDATDSIVWWKGGAPVATTFAGTSLTMAESVGTADFKAYVYAKDAKGCKNTDSVDVTVILNPGAPQFAHDSLFFCTKTDINIDTTGRASTPHTGDFKWDTSNPNVVKLPGTYVAHYEIIAQSSTCKSANDTVEVLVPTQPTFNVSMKYNSESAVVTQKERCYDAAAADTLHVTVTPIETATLTYEYKINGVDTSNAMIITRTAAGTYTDSIYIKATMNYPHGVDCTWDTTVAFRLIVDTLPTAPVNFPNVANGYTDTVIYYCQNTTADYTFTPKAGYTYTYTDGVNTYTEASRPDTAGDYKLVVTDNVTGCSNKFGFEIVKVLRPVVEKNHASKDTVCAGETVYDTINVTITNAASINASYTRMYVWNPGDSVANLLNTNSATYVFTTDTMVTVKTGIYAANGDYTATCFKTPDTVTVTFQPLPTKPVLNTTYAYFVDSTTVAYCYDTDTLPVHITTADFTTSPNAHVSIVGYTKIDTAGIYKIVANNDHGPQCPSDTLTLTVIKERQINAPEYFANYGDTAKVYYCEDATVSYDFGNKDNAADSLVYYLKTPETALASQPDTAGVYFLRIYDTASRVGCYVDFEFSIIEVPTPSATFTTSASWVDSNVCEGTALVLDYTINSIPNVVYKADTAYTWSTDSSLKNTAHFEATPTADTTVYYIYTLKDTVGSGTHGVACSYTHSDTITYSFFNALTIHSLANDTAFCAGETVVIDTAFYSVTIDTITYNWTPSVTVGSRTVDLIANVALPDSVAAASDTIIAFARYTAFTSCKSSNDTVIVVRHELPTVAIAPGDSTICKGDSVLYTASGAVKYVWSTSATDTLSTIFAKDTGAYIVTGTDIYNCSNKDTVIISFAPVFEVRLAPQDTTVCVDSSAVLTATADGGSGDFTFHWYKNDQYSSVDYVSETTTNPNTFVAMPDSSIKVNGLPIPSRFLVKVVDNVYNCISDTANNVFRVAAYSGARIEFRQIDSTNSVREMTVKEGQASAFEMYIYDNGACPCNEDEKVFIDFKIYKDGAEISDSELDDNMEKMGGSIVHNTEYNFTITAADAGLYDAYSPNTVISAMNTSVGSVPNGTNTEFISGYTYAYDWLYMHFVLGPADGMGGHPGRKIKISTGMWKPGSEGRYTFAYSVVKASPSATDWGVKYNGMKKVGGNNGWTAVKDVIIFDSFDIVVEPDAGMSSDYAVPSVVTSSPETTAAETAMDMKVYPNPASNNVNVVMEGVSGQTVITIHDMSGKAITSMMVNIDNDGQIVNLPVENFSQGIYFIKAINGKAVMTKKLIIAR